MQGERTITAEEITTFTDRADDFIAPRRRAPRPHAALLFHEYMLSEAQDLLVAMNYVPTNTNATSPLKNISIKLIDPNLMLDQRDKWSRAYDSVFGRRAP